MMSRIDSTLAAIKTINSGARSRPLLVGKNKKVIGLMKDELGGDIMRESVALRPKMYTYKVESDEFKECKEMKKCMVKKDIKFEDYKRCLMTGEMKYRPQ